MERMEDFYIHGSVHRESNLIIVFQQDATYSVYVELPTET